MQDTKLLKKDRCSDENLPTLPFEAMPEFDLEPDFICVPKSEKQGKTTQAPLLPEPVQINPYNHFEQRASGLYHIEIDNKGEEKETWICSSLYVLGQTRDSESNAWGLLLEWQDPNDKIHRWAMPKALLVGRDVSAWLGRLVDEGLRVASHSKAKQSLAHFLSIAHSQEFILCVNSTGWHHEKYVFPSYIIEKRGGQGGQSGQSKNNNTLDIKKLSTLETLSGDKVDNERIVLQENSNKNPYISNGNFKDWQTTIGVWARGNSRLILSIGASLSAVLLYASNSENGGFNFVGASSTGKTTTLCVGASLWGKGASHNGYIQSWRATDNGLEGISCLHNDACLCLDELGQVSAKVLHEASYMLANGQGKRRARQDGTTRAIKSWRTVILSTGEKSITEKITEEGRKVNAGQLVRIVDISADAGANLGIFENLHEFESPQAFSEAIKTVCNTHFGHLAPLFIQKIIDEPNVLQMISSAIPKITTSLCCENAYTKAIDGQIQRVAKKFALAIIAAEKATEWGLLPWKKWEALHACRMIFDEWIVQRGGMGSHEDMAIYEQIMLFIEQHGKSRFQNLQDPEAPCSNRVGFYDKTENGTFYYCLPQSFKAEICKGFNATQALKILEEKRLLVKGDKGFLKKLPGNNTGLGRKRCYTLYFGGEHDVE